MESHGNFNGEQGHNDIYKSLKEKDEGLSGEQAKPLSPPWGSMDYFKLQTSKFFYNHAYIKGNYIVLNSLSSLNLGQL